MKLLNNGRNTDHDDSNIFDVPPINDHSDTSLHLDIHDHIKGMFKKLTRNPEDWLLGALEDEKVPLNPDGSLIIYISDSENIETAEHVITNARKTIEDRLSSGSEVLNRKNELATLENLTQVEIRRLPRDEDGKLDIPLDQHGLLYLPHPYIVPGVRFNEMYNWDTAFTVRGLVEGGDVAEAKHLADNMLYQVEHYGTILNGNRSYYMDEKPRSQPPLLTSTVMAVYNEYDQIESPAQDKVEWLKHAAEMSEKYHGHWVTAPHIDEGTGLSKYNSDNGKPGDEVFYSEPEHYALALSLLMGMHDRQKEIGDVPMDDLPYQDRKDRYYMDQYLDFDDAGTPHLTEDFYRGDRAMRESGFDPSRLFGFFNVDIINHLPVSLNSLRYKMEEELSDMYGILAKEEPGNMKWPDKQAEWQERAAATKEKIQTHLYDDGLDADGNSARYPAFRALNTNVEMREKYNIEPFRDYNMAVGFFPLWTGIASQEQADHVVGNLLPKLMTDHGMMTSDKQTGSQWDAPIIWAPLQIIAMESLENYGYYEEARDIGQKFLDTVMGEYARTGQIFEKYEGINGTSNTAPFVNNGYSTNDVGFAWTNAAVLDIENILERIEAKMNDVSFDNDNDHEHDPDRDFDQLRV